MWQLFLVPLQTAKDTKDTVLVQIQPVTSAALDGCITIKECQDTTRVLRRPLIAKHRIQDIQSNMRLPQSSHIISIAPSSWTRKSHATCGPKVVLWNRPRGELKSLWLANCHWTKRLGYWSLYITQPSYRLCFQGLWELTYHPMVSRG